MEFFSDAVRCNPMNFLIDQKIFETFPDLHIGVLVAKDIDNTRALPAIQEHLRKEEERIRREFLLENLPQHPKIEVWRNAYIKFGAKPKEHRSSVENLYRLVLNGVTLRPINNLVDAYNFISLKHMLPIGGEDTDKIQGDMRLTFASDHEASVLLLGDKEPRPPHVGEVIYKDDASTICRRWNWREADRTKLTEETKNCVLVIEGLPPVTRGEIEAAVEELKTTIETCCGGSKFSVILDREHATVSL